MTWRSRRCFHAEVWGKLRQALWRLVTNRSIRIQVSAHVLDLELQLLLCSLRGPLRTVSASHLVYQSRVSTNLEGEMLEKVCSAIALVRFRATSSIDPHAYRRCLGPGRVLGGNLQNA
jgi:hypothetical protein